MQIDILFINKQHPFNSVVNDILPHTCVGN